MFFKFKIFEVKVLILVIIFLFYFIKEIEMSEDVKYECEEKQIKKWK